MADAMLAKTVLSRHRWIVVAEGLGYCSSCGTANNLYSINGHEAHVAAAVLAAVAEPGEVQRAVLDAIGIIPVMAHRWPVTGKSLDELTVAADHRDSSS